jgi:hypothetical protein
MILMVAQIIAKDSSTIDLDLRCVKDIDMSILDRQDISLPSYGIISNGGSLTITDAYETLISAVVNKSVSKGSNINIVLKNTLSNYTKRIGTFYIENMDYDSDTKIFKIDITDGLKDFQELPISQINYDFDNESFDTNMEEMWGEIKAKIKEANPSTIFAELDDDTSEHLKQIIIPFKYMDGDMAWSILDGFAQATQTHIFSNNNGEVQNQYCGGN